MSEDPHIVSISSSSPVSPDEIARKSFPAVRKGIDGEAVRAYLGKVATELRGALEREATLRERLVEAERRAADPELDEATLTKAIGVETAKILSTAHEAARNTVVKAEEQAAEMIKKAEGVLDEQVALARAEAGAIRAAAEQEAYEYAGQAQAEADTMTEEAHADAVELLDATKEECRRMVAEARDLRNRTLADLVARRRTLRVQLEELRGGKDSLLQVVDSLGAAVEHLRERLVTAEQEARVAAEDAGERAEEHAASDELGELEAELAAAGRALGEEAPARAEATPGAGPAAEGEPGAAVEAATGEAGEGVAREADHPSASRRSVDELFARIRASRAAEEAAEAGTIAAETVESAEAGEAGAPGESAGAGEAGESAGAGDAGPETVAPEGGQPRVPETQAAGAAETGEVVGGTPPADGKDEGLAAPAAEADEHTAEYAAVAVQVEVIEVEVIGTADTSAASATADETLAGETPVESAEAAVVQSGGAVFDVEALESEAAAGAARPDGRADPGAEGAAEAGAVVPVRIAGDAITEPDVESLARRDHLLSPVTAKLGRALKRALQDDQNDLLNALRQATRKPVLDELAPVGGQLERFVAAAGEHLAKAYEVGAAFLVQGDSVEGPSVSAPSPSETTSFQAGTALAAELADDLSGMLRQRIEEALSELDGSLEGSADAAGVAYREWKGSRVEGLAGDFTTRAFAVGELAVLESVAKGGGPLVRWAVEDDDGGGSCPDCDDNALAGPLVPGTGFPTGHSHPPVHPGCRCLLVPVRS